MTYTQAIEESLAVSLRHGYPAPIFRQMWRADPSMRMLENMMKQPDIQTGLKRMAELGLLKHSVEQVVIDYSLNREAVVAAEWRLRMVKQQRRRA